MKKAIFVGQAMPRFKSHPHDWPSLNLWLLTIGIRDKQIRKYFLYSALVDYFPGAFNGSHRAPSLEEIVKERPRLKKIIDDFDPDLVIPIGKLSISYCLNMSFKKLNEVVGKTYEADPYNLLGKQLTVIPLPHPSGASTWKHKDENKLLLEKALYLLKNNLPNRR
jgi:uracil-DNA glycosylase